MLATLGTNDRAIGEVWHVPNAPARTTTELVAMIGEELGSEIKISAAPEWLLRMMGLFADGEKFTKAFGMKATPLDQAVSETVAWWK